MQLSLCISIVDWIALNIDVTIAGYDAIQHTFNRVAGEEHAERWVGIAGAEVGQAVSISLFDDKAKTALSTIKILTKIR